MKQYKIYEFTPGNYKAVKQGWSWPAFFFTFIWAMTKNMWGIAVACFVLDGVICGRYGYTSEAYLTIDMIISIIFGASGNKWRENNIQKKGYSFKSTVMADNPETAIALYMR